MVQRIFGFHKLRSKTRTSEKNANVVVLSTLGKQVLCKSDLTRGLRLKVQAEGELITSGIVDALEEVDVSPALVVNGSAGDSVDVLLNQLEDGL